MNLRKIKRLRKTITRTNRHQIDQILKIIMNKSDYLNLNYQTKIRKSHKRNNLKMTVMNLNLTVRNLNLTVNK